MTNRFDKKTIKKGLLPYVFLFVIALMMIFVFGVVNKEVHVLTYNEFIL